MILSLFFPMETWFFYITFCHHVTRIKTYVTLDFPFRFCKFETVRSRGTFVLVSDSSHLANMSSLFQRFSFDVIVFLSVHDLPLRVHLETAHPATRRRGEVVATSLCTSPWQQIRLRWNTQRRLSGMSPWRLIEASWQRLNST